MHMNQCNLPPYKLKHNDKGSYITSGSGIRIARIWNSGICDEENSKMIEFSMNNNFRFAAALAIAINKLKELGIEDMPEINNCFNGELNFKQLDKFEQ